MEEIKNELEDASRAISTTNDRPALDIIRTETVLSRLPVHNLAKKGNVNIQIIKTTPDGKIDLKWIVSYSDRYGQARQLAYKLDTIVINHRIDEQGRPLPKMICLGSLRDVADQLDLGGDTNKVRRALRQNASAFITAKFEYRGNDGSKKTLEADFTRYSVVFTGEQLPDGRRADAVYIILNEPYREVLNNAPVRPLDRAYMKTLPPAAQRFYEIISYKIFSAIKNDYPNAKIAYSEYCTFSAQLRHLERQPVQDQMAKVIRPHKESGYITAVRYEPTIDATNQPDWILHLTPGPKAIAEFDVAHGRRRKLSANVDGLAEVGERKLPYRRRDRGQHAQPESMATAAPTYDPQLIAEFTRRGITEKKTLEILANVKPGQDVVAQLELGDHLMKNPRFPIQNPPGFLIRLIESNTSVPESFETSAKRKAREENERQERERRAAEDARQNLEWEYDDYCQREADQFVAENPAAFDAVKEAKREEHRAQHPGFSAEMIESIAQHEAKREMRKQATLLTFEEFIAKKPRNPDFFLKSVAVFADAPLVSVRPAEEIVVTDEPAASSEEPPPTGGGRQVVPPGPEPSNDAAIELAARVSPIESATEPSNTAPAETAPAAPIPPIEFLSDNMEQGIALPPPPEPPYGALAA